MTIRWIPTLSAALVLGCSPAKDASPAKSPPAAKVDPAPAEAAKATPPAAKEKPAAVKLPTPKPMKAATELGTLPKGVGLAVGTTAPDAAMKTETGTDTSIAKLVADGPRLLVFYRGGW